MPKTPEEYEADIKALEAKHDGEITKLTTELETSQKHAVDLNTKIEAKDAELSSYIKAKREKKEAQFHAVTKDLSEETKKKISLLQIPLDKISNKEIDAFVGGFGINHAVAKAAPKGARSKPTSAASNTPMKNEAERLLDA